MVHMIFFFNDTATTEIYTLSLHDALPIYSASWPIDTQVSVTRTSAPSEAAAASSVQSTEPPVCAAISSARSTTSLDRKSTRLNSSHANISYAVFCLKKKKHNILFVTSIT